jgi:hypothetical protein
MIGAVCDTDGLTMLGQAYYEYLLEIEAARVVCMRHEKTAAIHERGTELQIYSLYTRDEKTAEEIRNNTAFLSGWEESPYHLADGKHWERLQGEVEKRMTKHSRLHPIVTRGIEWEDYPMLVHAYKFEPDPIMKIELVLPTYQSEAAPLPIKVVAAALQCLEFLVPSYVAAPLAPYDHHETKFSTIFEYLRRVMPKGDCASLSVL